MTTAPSDRPSARRRVAVIGAGAGGICAAKHLLAEGVDVEVFELGSHIGGLWVYDNDNERSPAYRSLHINSEARVTAYPDFPFPEGTPLYPSHEQVSTYLKDYADEFGVTPHIRFNTPVIEVQPTSDAGPPWLVTVAGGQESSFDGVVVATGHQGVPAHPPFADRFTGQYVHSRDYRTPEAFQGQRVLVIGTGNSALDIAADVCLDASSTTLCARSPVLIMPRMMFGVPTARVLAKLERPWMPWPIRRRIRVFLSRIAHGTMEQWGFETPATPTHPAGHQSLISHIAYEHISVRPGIAEVDGPTVRFVDGRESTFDVMIAATGYEVDLPFLPPRIVKVEDRRIELYKRVLAPEWEGIFFVGFFNVSGGANIRMMDVQAAWVTALVTGEISRPDRATMSAAIAAEQRELRRRYPDSPRYGLELDPLAYPRAVAQELR